MRTQKLGNNNEVRNHKGTLQQCATVPRGAQKTNHKENKMKRRNAVASFVIVCVILAILLLTQIISSIVGAIAFTVALVLFGGLSRGFRGNDASSKSK
jgi:hypothetical protein